MGHSLQAIDVWRRRQNGAVRYRCFEVLPSGRFWIQSADFFNLPVDKQRSDFSDRQFHELLIEQAPDGCADSGFIYLLWAQTGLRAMPGPGARWMGA